jgi:hypothetical protein
VDAVSLGTFKKGETTTLTYTIHVPEELTNKYALSATKTKWVFTTSLGSEGKTYTSSKSSSSSDDDSSSSSSYSYSSERPGTLEINSNTQTFSDDGVPLNPFIPSGTDTDSYGHKTGDSNIVQYALTVAGISTILLILVIISGKRKKRRHSRES